MWLEKITEEPKSIYRDAGVGEKEAHEEK